MDELTQQMSATAFTGTDVTGFNSIKTIGGSFIIYNSIVNPVQKFLVDTNGNLAAGGDIKYIMVQHP